MTSGARDNLTEVEQRGRAMVFSKVDLGGVGEVDLARLCNTKRYKYLFFTEFLSVIR